MNTKTFLHALVECTEGLYFHSEEQVSQLSVGKEHNEEHDGKPKDV